MGRSAVSFKYSNVTAPENIEIGMNAIMFLLQVTKELGVAIQ